MRRGSISSELLMCGRAVRSVCKWRMFVFMSIVVTVWWSVGMFVV